MKTVIFFIFLVHFPALSQTDPPKYTYSKIEYEVLNQDTITIKRTNGKYNEPDYKQWDSTYVSADLVLYFLPVLIDADSLTAVVSNIYAMENIQVASLWRDKHALRWRVFSYRSEEMRKQDQSSYIGRFQQGDAVIRFGYYKN